MTGLEEHLLHVRFGFHFFELVGVNPRLTPVDFLTQFVGKLQFGFGLSCHTFTVHFCQPSHVIEQFSFGQRLADLTIMGIQILQRHQRSELIRHMNHQQQQQTNTIKYAPIGHRFQQLTAGYCAQ